MSAEMLSRHRSHLVSTHTTVLQHIAEIRQAITAGKSPGGARLTPLPEPLRSRLLAGLDSIASDLGELVSHFAPDWERRATKMEGPAATKMWAAILLRTVEELVEDLEPSRLTRHYGAVREEDADLLRRRTAQVLKAVQEAIHLLE
jgi:antitoxin (DNA-binding transcriptional repressor) of toxin-antitoxin stability system